VLFFVFSSCLSLLLQTLPRISPTCSSFSAAATFCSECVALSQSLICLNSLSCLFIFIFISAILCPHSHLSSSHQNSIQSFTPPVHSISSVSLSFFRPLFPSARSLGAGRDSESSAVQFQHHISHCTGTTGPRSDPKATLRQRETLSPESIVSRFLTPRLHLQPPEGTVAAALLGSY
jgi:hypothetical protein